MKRRAYVLWYDHRDCYGIIKDEFNNEIYIDDSVLKCDKNDLKHKTPVLFNINTNIKSPMCGRDIEIVK